MLSLSMYIFMCLYMNKYKYVFMYFHIFIFLPHYSDRSKFLSLKKQYLLNSNINIDTYGLCIIRIKKK